MAAFSNPRVAPLRAAANPDVLRPASRATAARYCTRIASSRRPPASLPL